jgi:hypothetical protein
MAFSRNHIARLAVGSAIGVFLAAASASQAAFVTTIAPDGLGDVVATGSGSIDTTDLTSVITGTVSTTARVNPAHVVLVFGTPGANVTEYQGTITGPSSVGTTSTGEVASSTTGTYVFFDPTSFNVSPASPTIDLPASYVSGSSLSETDTWTSATIGSLGLNPGSYQWTWGTGVDADSYTINIAATPVPEPASLGLLGIGAAGLLGRGRRRLS